MERLLFCNTSLWIFDEETPGADASVSLISLGLTKGREGILNFKSGAIEELVVMSNKETYSLSDEEASLKESILTGGSASLTSSMVNMLSPVVSVLALSSILKEQIIFRVPP